MSRRTVVGEVAVAVTATVAKTRTVAVTEAGIATSYRVTEGNR